MEATSNDTAAGACAEARSSTRARAKAYLMIPLVKICSIPSFASWVTRNLTHAPNKSRVLIRERYAAETYDCRK